MTTTLDAEVIDDPIGLIVRLVTDVEPTLGIDMVRQEVVRVAGGRAKRRRLAQDLHDDPSLLTAGGPRVP